MDALSEALGQWTKKSSRSRFVNTCQRTLRRFSQRRVFVTSMCSRSLRSLRTSLPLVGYYRLLLGAPQKSFYKGTTGMGRFKSMEDQAQFRRRADALPEFLHAMASPLQNLYARIPRITERDLHELPLLTFGSQLQGSNNTQIGKTAMRDVFVAIKEMVGKFVVAGNRKQIESEEFGRQHSADHLWRTTQTIYSGIGE